MKLLVSMCTCQAVAHWLHAARGELGGRKHEQTRGRLQRVRMLAALRVCSAGEEVITRESFISICWRLIPCGCNIIMQPAHAAEYGHVGMQGGVRLAIQLAQLGLQITQHDSDG